MTALDSQDLLWAVRRLPKYVVDTLKKYPRVFVAGGYLRSTVTGERVEDIDLFVPSVEEAKQVAAELCALTGKGKYETANAITIRTRPMPVQIIHRWTFERPEDALASFDYTIAKAAIWWEEGQWQSLIDPRFYVDAAAKRLTYTRPERNEDAGGSLLRMLKFYQRGYRIPLDSLGAVVARIAMGVVEIGDQWAGEEAHLGRLLTALLREVDPLVDPDHISHLPPATRAEQTDEDIPF